MSSLLLLAVFVVSCSILPTPYQREKQKAGYRDKAHEDLFVARFRGNSKTSKERAQRYAEFRAIDNCMVQNKHANILELFDKTIEKEVIRSSGSGWGPSYVGFYPYYGHHSSFGIGAGFNTMSNDSWSETLILPHIELFYNCAHEIFRPEMTFKELPAEEIKHLVKDVKGGIQIEKIDSDSPNKSSFEIGDIIIKIDGRRVENVFEILRQFTSDGSEVTTQVLREGKKKLITMKAIEITEQVEEAEQKILGMVCKEKDDKNQKVLKDHKLCLK